MMRSLLFEFAVKPPAVRGKPGTGRGKKGSTSESPAFSDDAWAPVVFVNGDTDLETAELQEIADRMLANIEGPEDEN